MEMKVLRTTNGIVFLVAGIICGSTCASEATGYSVNKLPVTTILACPSRDFHIFFRDFTEKIEIQRTFTSFPLAKQVLDLHVEPEPKPIQLSLSRNQVSFPLLPDRQHRKLRSLDLKLDELSPAHSRVTLKRADTDYQILYFFSLRECWYLDRIEDWSL